MSIRYEPGAIVDESFIPLCVPELRGNEWVYIKDCLDTNWVSSVGAYVERFERMVADFIGVPYAVATVNGTAALHTALLVADVQPNDEVIVSTLTFIAPANAIRYVGAYPVFIDAEPNYWQMDVERLRTFLTQQCDYRDGQLINRLTKRRVRAIIPVHILGHTVDIEPICALAKAYGLTVIEDATEALGAEYQGQKAGSFGDMACFSFNGNKLITTGGGGMLVTRFEEMAKRASYLTTQAKDDPVEYIHHETGYNYRLTNIQAAMGCAQMEQLEAYLAQKRAIALRYEHAFSQLDGIYPMPQASWMKSAFWLYTIQVDEQQTGFTSRELKAFLETQKIITRPLWQPMHQSPAFLNQHTILGGAVAEHLNRTCLSIPCSVGLSEAQQERVIYAITQFVQHKRNA